MFTERHEITQFGSMSDEELRAEIRRKLEELKFIEGTCGSIEDDSRESEARDCAGPLSEL
jgi:hypothetical protein